MGTAREFNAVIFIGREEFEPVVQYPSSPDLQSDEFTAASVENGG